MCVFENPTENITEIGGGYRATQGLPPTTVDLLFLFNISFAELMDGGSRPGAI